MASSPTGDQSTPKRTAVGPQRIPFMTASAKRHQPYALTPERIERRQKLLQELTMSENNQQSILPLDTSSLPTTRALLSGIRSPSSPATNDPPPSNQPDIHTSLRKACIDWKLVNKEAEVIRLRTEHTKLQSLLSSMKEEKEKAEIESDRRIRELECQLSGLQHKLQAKIREVDDLRVQVESLEARKQQAEAISRPDQEYLDKSIVDFKVNEAKLRGQLLDANEQLRTLKLKHDQEMITLKHEVKCLGIELKGVKDEKEILERRRDELVNAVRSVPEMRNEIKELKEETKRLQEIIDRQSEEITELRSRPQPSINVPVFQHIPQGNSADEQFAVRDSSSSHPHNEEMSSEQDIYHEISNVYDDDEDDQDISYGDDEPNEEDNSPSEVENSSSPVNDPPSSEDESEDSEIYEVVDDD